MPQRTPLDAPPRTTGPGGADGNSRLTGSVAVVIFILLALEGVTIIQITGLLTPHVFVGVLLIPPTLVKIGSTGWRFARYYRGDPDYVRKGPPNLILRLLGPVVVILTTVVLASGVGLLFVPHALRATTLFIHQASFVLWFGAMTLHVLGHLAETTTLAPRDWLRRTRGQVGGATVRQWILAASLVVGVFAALLVTPHANGWWSSI